MMESFEYDLVWAEALRDKIIEKLERTGEEIKTRYPYSTVDGLYDSYPGNIRRWTNGFWSGLMWLSYLASGKSCFMQLANEAEQGLDYNFEKYTELDHDVGFLWIPTALANYRITGNARSRERALHAASLLSSRYNLAGGYIRAWNLPERRGYAIIDCMMNIPILYWASEEEDDPRWKQIAISEANTVMKHFVRDDGSVYHIVEFNPDTGEVVSHPRGQGYAEGSSWSRGQAWAIYGFMLSYIHTGDERYLDVSKRVAHYVMENIDDSGIPRVDYRQPAEPHKIDTTAGAITACGLIELAKHSDGVEKITYMRFAQRLLKALEKYCNFDRDEQSILQMGAEQYHVERTNKPIIYGDYYLLEGLMKMLGNETFIW